jgi:hypothetical protein
MLSLHQVIVPVTVIAALVAGQGSGLRDCWSWNGQPHPNNTRCPGSNACCGIADECVSNRLCHKPADSPNKFVRGPCAVNPYDSGTCAQICLYNETGIFPRVTTCADGSLCCDNDSRCCEKGDGIFLDEEGRITDSPPSTLFTWGSERTASTFRMSTESSTSTSTSTSTSSESSSTGPSSENTETSRTTSVPASANTSNDLEKNPGEEKDGSDGSMAIGLGVGLGVGISLIAGALGLWFFMRRRKRGDEVRAPQYQQPVPVVDDKQRYTGRMPESMYTNDASTVVSELPPDSRLFEVDGTSQTMAELDAHDTRRGH